jgi:type IV secretory pathway VirB3-like protein
MALFRFSDKLFGQKDIKFLSCVVFTGSVIVVVEIIFISLNQFLEPFVSAIAHCFVYALIESSYQF